MKVDSVVLQVPMVTMAKLELRDLQVYRYVRSLNSTCQRESRHIDPHTSDMLTLFSPFPLSLWRNTTGIDGAQRRERRVRRYWSPRIDGTPRFTWTTCKSLSPLYNNIPTHPHSTCISFGFSCYRSTQSVHFDERPGDDCLTLIFCFFFLCVFQQGYPGVRGEKGDKGESVMLTPNLFLAIQVCFFTFLSCAIKTTFIRIYGVLPVTKNAPSPFFFSCHNALVDVFFGGGWVVGGIERGFVL